MTSKGCLSVYANSRPKIIVILTSVLLFAGMLFVPAKQVERAPGPNQLKYWYDRGSFDIIKDWDKIKDVLDRTIKRAFDAICSNCKKEIQVPFKPDGLRPVYCSDCRSSKRIPRLMQ